MREENQRWRHLWKHWQQPCRVWGRWEKTDLWVSVPAPLTAQRCPGPPREERGQCQLSPATLPWMAFPQCPTPLGILLHTVHIASSDNKDSGSVHFPIG